MKLMIVSDNYHSWDQAVNKPAYLEHLPQFLTLLLMQQVSSITAQRTLRYTFEAFELPALLEKLRQEYPNCAIHLECSGTSKPRKRVLIFQKGELGFCGKRMPTLGAYIDLIQDKISSDWIDRICEDIPINMQEEMSPLQFIERLINFRVLSKGKFLKIQVSAFLLALESVYHSPGTLSLEILDEQERLLTVEWRLISLALGKRQRSWDMLAEQQCTMNSVPILVEEAIAQSQEIGSDQETESDIDIQLLNYLQRILDNRSNITDISYRERKDPLSIAQKLAKACEKGWVTFLDEPEEANFDERPRILVIDENATTRKLLVRLLQAGYDAFETSSSLEAVSLIASKQINAIIVSQSLPISSSFRLCRIIRQTPNFKHLPIFLIANKENLFEKAKAKMAGVTEYLCNPVDQTKILSMIELHL